MSTLTCQYSIVEVFSIFDDFANLIALKPGCGRKAKLNLAEVATISLIRSEFNIRTWKGLYKLLKTKFKSEFNLPNYKNFVETMNRSASILLVLINALLQINQKQAGVIKLVDSTSLPVCKNKRIKKHKTMKRLASRKKSTMGWFYGLKLHIVSDLMGNILMIKFTTGSVDDRVILDKFLDKLNNSLIIADAGYVSSRLSQKANKNNNILLTVIRNNMKKVTTHLQNYLLNLRPRVETVFSILKEKLGLVTSLPRSEMGYLAHYIHCIFGYMAVRAFRN